MPKRFFPASNGLAITCACVAVLFIGTLVAGCTRTDEFDYYIAEYPDCNFAGGPYFFFAFNTGGSGDKELSNKIASVYIRLAKGEVIELPKLTEEKALAWKSTDCPCEVETTEEDGRRITYYAFGLDKQFGFSEGKLVSCSLMTDEKEKVGPLAGLQLGPSADGEFLSFPISRDKLPRVFGQPIRVKGVKQGKR